jgi:hypothetical protein
MLRELIPEHHLLMQVISFLKANAPHRSALWKSLWNSFYTCRLVGTLNVSLFASERSIAIMDTAIHPSGHRFYGVSPPPVRNLMAADMAIRMMFQILPG